MIRGKVSKAKEMYIHKTKRSFKLEMLVHSIHFRDINHNTMIYHSILVLNEYKDRTIIRIVLKTIRIREIS